mmetsp:Transcript_91342/g.254355  ORF Transcript_91342/g.254355 Transcript_91342/m.254355 type:complete len:287 (+) Transcript_91342:547-1407(+)
MGRSVAPSLNEGARQEVPELLPVLVRGHEALQHLSLKQQAVPSVQQHVRKPRHVLRDLQRVVQRHHDVTHRGEQRAGGGALVLRHVRLHEVPALAREAPLGLAQQDGHQHRHQQLERDVGTHVAEAVVRHADKRDARNCAVNGIPEEELADVQDPVAREEPQHEPDGLLLHRGPRSKLCNGGGDHGSHHDHEEDLGSENREPVLGQGNRENARVHDREEHHLLEPGLEKFSSKCKDVGDGDPQEDVGEDGDPTLGALQAPLLQLGLHVLVQGDLRVLVLPLPDLLV